MPLDGVTVEEVEIPLPRNVLHNQSQILRIDKIATFIGGNGSGKSTILKSIFDAKLNSNQYENYRVVCFSSGQNESYSKGFSDYLSQERAKKRALSLDCFYYDKSLSKLLVFLATTGNHLGLVRKFLRERNYIKESEFDEDESTMLELKVRVDKAYTNLVAMAISDEQDGKTDVITNKGYHRTLQSFIQALINQDYQFDTELSSTRVSLGQKELSKVSFEGGEDNSFDPKVMFFTQASDNDYFIQKDDLELRFQCGEKVLYLEDLSDGEYQLLFLYALVDLLDSEKTMFLFDEADSHLHYKNIAKIWDVFSSLKGVVITTTHLLDSIVKSGVPRIRIVEHGEVKPVSDLNGLVRRLDDLSEIENVKFQALSLYENIVLMDDEDDWIVFKELVYRKLSCDAERCLGAKRLLNGFVVVKQESGYDGSQSVTFAKSKLKWLSNYVNFLNGAGHKNKNIFLVCDRDQLQRVNIGRPACSLLVKQKDAEVIAKGSGVKSHLLSWKRREILHYLLSYTALSEECDDINEMLDLSPGARLREMHTGDKKLDGSINEVLCVLDSSLVKRIVAPFVNDERGCFCVGRVREFISGMPPEEISSDIEEMYNYLEQCND